MANEFKVEEVQAALIAALKLALPDANVDAIASDQVDKDGNLVLAGPQAVAVLYEQTVDTEKRAQTRTLYDTTHQFLVLCGARNLRGATAEQADSAALVSTVRAALAGLALELGSDESPFVTAPMALSGVERVQFDQNGSWYGVRVLVTDVTQFDPKV